MQLRILINYAYRTQPTQYCSLNAHREMEGCPQIRSFREILWYTVISPCIVILLGYISNFTGYEIFAKSDIFTKKLSRKLIVFLREIDWDPNNLISFTQTLSNYIACNVRWSVIAFMSTDACFSFIDLQFDVCNTHGIQSFPERLVD